MATLRELIERMATDAAFAREVRADPDSIGSANGLSAAEVDLLRSLTDGSIGGPEALKERLSKSGFSFGGGLMGLLDPAGIIGPDDPAFSDSSSTSISDSTVSISDSTVSISDSTVPGPFDADPGGMSTESDLSAAPAPQKVSVPALPTMSGHSLLGPDTSSLGPAMAVPAGIVGADYGAAGDGVAILCNGARNFDEVAVSCNGFMDGAAIGCNLLDDDGVAISCNGARDGVAALSCNGFIPADGEAAILCNNVRNLDEPTLKSEAG